MTGDLENEAALDHPGNAVVKCLTVGLDPWEAHELGGDDNTTNSNSVTINHIQLGIISTFRPFPLRPLKKADLLAAREYRVRSEKEVRLVLIEPRGVLNAGDAGGDRTAQNDVWI